MGWTDRLKSWVGMTREERVVQRDRNLDEWQNQFNERGSMPETTQREVVKVVREYSGRRPRIISKEKVLVDYRRLMTRYRSERTKRDPEWFWFNMTNDEQMALTQTGVLTTQETNQQLSFYRGGNTGGKFPDKKVKDWEESGYQQDWDVFVNN